MKEVNLDLMSQKEKVKHLREWCDNEVDNGRDVIVNWDGGNDSGCVTWEGDSPECQETDLIVDMMYEQLDYGSWAGDFTASGSASYDKDKKEITGEDAYSETEWPLLSDDITISIPAHLYCKQIEWNIVSEDQDITVSIEATVTDGFISKELSDCINSETARIQEQLSTILKELLIENKGDNDIFGSDDSGAITYEELVKSEDGRLVGKLEGVHYRQEVYDYKFVALDLDENNYED